MENLLPASKNIGSTHITNGAYRMHPVEWSIGEAAGALAAFCVERGARPRQVRATRKLLRDFQSVLGETLGVPLAWPAYVALDRSLIANWFWPPPGMAPGDGSPETDNTLRSWS
jgi:hypothetical protein